MTGVIKSKGTDITDIFRENLKIHLDLPYDLVRKTQHFIIN
jgi:hypothetical protein